MEINEKNTQNICINLQEMIHYIIMTNFTLENTS